MVQAWTHGIDNAHSIDLDSWYSQTWKGKWICSDANKELDLIATGSDGKRVSLQRLRCDKAAEMLGVWLDPNGNKDKVISVLKRSALEWGSKVRLGNP